MSIFIIKCLTYEKLPFVTPILLCRPFPFRHPNIYKSDPSKNICVTDGSSQQTQHVLLDVLAMQNEDENGLDEIDFFGLTHIDGARIPTNNLVDESFTSELSIPTVNNPSGTTYKFNHIPTIKTDINNDLFKYHDNKDPNINWSRLIGFDDLFFVLQLNNPLEFSSNKTITFLFPPTDTITNRLEIINLSKKRHHCNLIPCTDMLFCPATLQSPTTPPQNHQHCSSKYCVRFFEPPLSLF